MQFCLAQVVVETEKDDDGQMATRFGTYSVNAYGRKESRDVEEGCSPGEVNAIWLRLA